MRHFLVNTEKISFAFSHCHGSSLPVCCQDELPNLLTLLCLTVLRAPPACPGSPPVSKPQVCCFFLYLPPDLYYCKPPEAPAAIRASQGLLLVLCTPNEQHNLTHKIWFSTATPKSRRSVLKSPYICPAGLCCEFCGSGQHKNPELS